MGTECIGAHLKDEADGIPSVPPGFETLVKFTMKKAEKDEATNNSRQPQIVNGCISDEGRFKKSLRHRPWVNYSLDNSSEEESEQELKKDTTTPKRKLPKGVIRGCAECANCQKVTAKWRPEDARRPVLDEAPVFYPTEEEFSDTLKYIASIRPKAEPYGICRIVPPSTWSPPCPLKEKNVWENSNFQTRIQMVHKLQNRASMKKSQKTQTLRRKRQKIMNVEDDKTNMENMGETNTLGYKVAERFGFEPGPNFTLDSFQKYADDFKMQYFQKKDIQSEPSPESIEGEYWRIVENPTEEIEVLYGADLETGDFGSGFPKQSTVEPGSNIDDQYVKSGWNLNNLPRLPESVLSFESGDISGVLVPWLYIGMCFSSFCWHVEDHHLYSMNYMHWGAPKMWYGVPGSNSSKLEDAMKKHLAELFEEQPDLLHNLVTQFSPSMLKLEGVPVYRCLQRPGEFVLTFPRAYHSGFNCGFNCAEAVNVAPLDWLPHGQIAVELYCQQARKISVSHDKLLLGAAKEAVRAQWNVLFMRQSSPDILKWKNACGSGGILAKSLKARVEVERMRREFLCSMQSRKMEADFDANCERECIACNYDLHLSATGCSCSPNKYACLTHTKLLCSCDWSSRFFLYRYDIKDLNTLVDALGGKLSAVHRWGVNILGLRLSMVAKKDKSPEPKLPLNRNVTSLHETKTSVPQNSSIKSSVPQNSSTSSLKKTTVVSKEPSEVQSHLSCKSEEDQKPSTSNQSSSIKIVSCKDKNISAIEKVIILTEDTWEGPIARDLSKEKEGSVMKTQETSTRPQKDTLLVTPETNTSVTTNGVSKSLARKEGSVLGTTNTSSHLQQQELGMGAKTNDDAKAEQVRNHMDTGELVAASPSVVSNDRLNHTQKGPRIAKVVRKINWTVETLEYGVIFSGKLWSNSQSIFPKGYRSRVRYFSILDPSQMCYYICEILDAGLPGPLFMVKVEQCPGEVFVNSSPAKCWDMVRDRVNEEIRRQQISGKTNFPSLQHPRSLDGLEMFGLTSQTTVKAIEDLDRYHECIEYWSSRPQTPAALRPTAEHLVIDEAFKTLLKKGSLNELQALRTVLNNDQPSFKRELLDLLDKEIRKFSR